MNFINLMYTHLNIIHIICVLNINSLTIFQSLLKREIRFTKINSIIANTSLLTINESAIKQYYNQQRLFLHFFVHKPITELHVNFNVIKCKEHYIDCYSVVSYDVCEACSKLNILNHLRFNYIASTQKEVNSCPIYGDYYYRNLSIDADKLGQQFSLSSERYWEYYWKIYVNGYMKDNFKFVTISIEFYFIEFRSRKRQQ